MMFPGQLATCGVQLNPYQLTHHGVKHCAAHDQLENDGVSAMLRGSMLRQMRARAGYGHRPYARTHSTGLEFASHCDEVIHRDEGAGLGAHLQVLRVIPYSAAQLYSYELFKRRFSDPETRKLSVWSRLAAGACAGMASTIVRMHGSCACSVARTMQGHCNL